MNRHTRTTLLGVFLALLTALFWSATGRAQQEGKTAQLLKLHRACVFDVIESQLRSSGSAVNPSAASEVAFQSCRTEEQALFAHASSGSVSQVQANQVITDYKLEIKQRVRKIFADAEKAAVQRARQAPAIEDCLRTRKKKSQPQKTKIDGDARSSSCRTEDSKFNPRRSKDRSDGKVYGWDEIRSELDL
jgi:hypothetical protein